MLTALAVSLVAPATFAVGDDDDVALAPPSIGAAVNCPIVFWFR